jgi:nitrate/TMAO reductase-like tetraheme cytochrome c subunit
MTSSPRILVLFTLTALALASAALRAQGPDNATCLGCHSDLALVSSTGKKVGVDEKRFAASLHGAMGMACVACHADLNKKDLELPHAATLAKVNCAGCHEAAVNKYNEGIHAQARRQSASSVAAACADCHTSHEIRSSKDPESTTYAINLPATCSRCHGDPEIIRQGNIRIGNIAAMYKDSIHGRAVSKSGLTVAANCTSCHGSHDVRKKDDPASLVHRNNLPDMCGACHGGIKTQYSSGVHGRAVEGGSTKAPVCADCHTAHEIQRAEASSWQLDVIRECGTCHEDKIKTYRDTFHGQVTSLGFVRVATCAACHGSHSIYPSSDERSMTSPAKLLTTCQQCHPNATEGFTQFDPHADKHNRERNPVLYFASQFMTWLLVGVFGFFGLHAVMWLPRGFRERKRLRAEHAARSAEESPADRTGGAD